MTLLQQYLASVKELAGKATEGPWYWNEFVVRAKGDEYHVAQINDGEYIENRNHGDPHFIAESRSIVPKLVEIVELQEKELKELKEMLEVVATQMPRSTRPEINNELNRHYEMGGEIRARIEELIK